LTTISWLWHLFTHKNHIAASLRRVERIPVVSAGASPPVAANAPRPQAAILASLALLLTACGGGSGGSGGGASLSLQPSSVSVSTPEGLSTSFSVDGTVTGTIEGVVNVLILDSEGVIQPNVSFNEINNRTYRATLSTLPTLAPGTYAGTLEVKLCGGTPPACSPQYASASLAYEFNVGTDPVPVITSLSPNQREVRPGSFQLTVSGSNFWPGAVIHYDGTPRATTYLSPTSLRTNLVTDDVRTGGVRDVVVVNPEAVASEPSPFTVLNRVPDLVALGPTVTTAGCNGSVLTVQGVHLASSAQVFWNDVALQTTAFNFNDQLSTVNTTIVNTLLAIVPPTLVAQPGDALITVRNPLPGGGASLARTFNIREDSPPSSPATAYRLDAGRSSTAWIRCPIPVSPNVLWSVDVGGPASYALLAEGKVIVTAATASGAVLFGLQQANGQVVWGPVSVGETGHAAWDEGVVYVAATADPALSELPGDGLPASIQAYDAATGTLLWRHPVLADFPVTLLSTPVAVDGRLFVTFGDGANQRRLGAWSQFDGSALWQAVSPSAVSPPAVSGGMVFVSTSCETSAWSVDSGTSQWTQGSSCASPEDRRLVVVDDIVYPGRKGNQLPYYAAASGALLGNYVGGRELVVADGRGYMVTNQNRIAAIDLVGGAVQWDSPYSSGNAIPPLVASGVIWITQGDRVDALDVVTGRPVWRVPAAGLVYDPHPLGAQAHGISIGDGLLAIPAGNRVNVYRVGNPD